MNYKKNVKEISTKGLTKNLVDKCVILNGVKHFFSEIF